MAVRMEESPGARTDGIQSSQVHFKLHCQETETGLTISGLWWEEVLAQENWYLQVIRPLGHVRFTAFQEGCATNA